MKKALKILGWMHLLLLLVAVSLLTLQIELFSMLPLTIIGLMGTIVFFSLNALRLDNLIQITFGFVAGILPYLLMYTIYFAPSFLKSGWIYLMILTMVLLFKVLMVLNQTGVKSQRVFGAMFTISICPLIFGMGSPVAWNIGFGLVILTSIFVVVWPRIKKEQA